MTLGLSVVVFSFCTGKIQWLLAPLLGNPVHLALALSRSLSPVRGLAPNRAARVGPPVAQRDKCWRMRMVVCCGAEKKKGLVNLVVFQKHAIVANRPSPFSEAANSHSGSLRAYRTEPSFRAW
ncbi:hypothetical protein CAOG_009814 [Capsaspora owczarzaki ATCC 30864]|uniref:Uncharacterized protein n=1 Tax=Capsaspora owczarzaki (strain ATCC 30864) TaxID=595528 RepID=A0A0D2UH38_CAPO3|nr:hypothetical protein CAOG_009814 [Capsaspora owczarzaki ATCC 30864]